MAIYTPYFYIIQDIRNGMYYAGAKWAQGCHPVQLLKEDGYLTSSETIKKIIDENGLDTFVIRKIRTFETAEDAYDYETRFLVKVDAKKHLRFYNRHNNNHLFNFHDEKYKEKMNELYGSEYISRTEHWKESVKKTSIEKYGTEHYSQTDECKEKTKQTNLEKYGVEFPFQNVSVQDKQKNTMLIKYGVENYTQTDEYNQKVKETSLEKYGVEHFTKSDIVKTKIINSNLERYGHQHPMQSVQTKQKLKETNLEKYGVNYHMQTDEFKKKKGEMNRNKRERTLVNLIFDKFTPSQRREAGLKHGWYLKSDEKIEMIYNELCELNS